MIGQSKKIFVQQDEEGNWVQGHWCPELKDARINVLNGQNVNLNENIKILKRPTFWNIASNKLSWRKVPQGGVAIQIFHVVPTKMMKNEKNINRKFNQKSNSNKNTQLIQANKMGKLIKDGEQAYLCMIRPRETWNYRGIQERTNKAERPKEGFCQSHRRNPSCSGPGTSRSKGQPEEFA